jgi:hypothetical protein
MAVTVIPDSALTPSAFVTVPDKVPGADNEKLTAVGVFVLTALPALNDEPNPEAEASTS